MPGDPLDALRLPLVPIEPRAEFAAALARRIEGLQERVWSQVATVRYFVDDLDSAVRFYCGQLGFEEELRPSALFAMLYRGDLRLLLSVPGEAHALPDGSWPEPGGWNRISLRVEDLARVVEELRSQGAHFLTEIAAGIAVDTVLLRDPAGNPVELFQARGGYHERAPDDAVQPRDTDR
jgi:catechol 2,3-dioxygenase-like lactoylglutathione lyase family enzyme